MDCANTRNDRIISVTEHGRTFRLDNPNRQTLIEVKVDDCLIKGERERCDYLFEVPTPKSRVCYVELKGKHIEKAVQQIRSTLDYTRQQYAGRDKEAYIVSSRVPSSGTDIQALKMRLKRDCQASLTIKNIELTVSVP